MQEQFAEMERLHLHALQLLQLELSEARERSRTYSDEPRATQNNLKDTSHLVHVKESEHEGSGGNSPAYNSKGLQNGNAEIVSSFASTGNAEIVSSFASTGNALTQANQIPAAQMAQSLHGLPSYLPPGQLTALHPFVMHQQGTPQNLKAHLVPSHVGHFHSIPTHSSLQHWQNHEALSDGSQVPNHENHPSKNDQNLLRSEANYDHEVSVTGQPIRSDYADVHISQGTESHPAVPSSIVGQEKNAITLSNHGGEAQSSTTENLGPSVNVTEAIRSVKFSESTENKVAGTIIPEGFVGIGQRMSSVVGKIAETLFLTKNLCLLVMFAQYHQVLVEEYESAKRF